MNIDLNADLGEIEGIEGERIDAEMLVLVSSVNVVTGGHAGDQHSMTRVCRIAVDHGVVIGAHLSYPDRAGFGRAPRSLPEDALAAELTGQLERLAAIASAAGGRVGYVKPHGALYNDAAAERSIAAVLLDVARPFDLPILTLPAKSVSAVARETGQPTFSQGFPDRAYEPDGTLRSRAMPDAILSDGHLVATRALRMATQGCVVAHDGSVVRLRVASLFVHGETPGAAALAIATRRRLLDHGVEVSSFVKCCG